MPHTGRFWDQKSSSGLPLHFITEDGTTESYLPIKMVLYYIQARYVTKKFNFLSYTSLELLTTVA